MRFYNYILFFQKEKSVIEKVKIAVAQAGGCKKATSIVQITTPSVFKVGIWLLFCRSIVHLSGTAHYLDFNFCSCLSTTS